MAETFSYDNTPDTEVLTAEEQNSLEVGEQLVAEQEQLLAGKYKSAEELESAYLSLQKKLGQKKKKKKSTTKVQTKDMKKKKEAMKRYLNMLLRSV